MTSAALLSLAVPAYAAPTTTSTRAVVVSDPDDDGYGQLYDVPLDGGTPALLFGADTGTDVADPALSADASKIAYVEDVNDDFDYLLKVRNGDGTGTPVALTNSALDASEPAWSRDGSTIVFVQTNPNTGTTSLYTVPSDGSAPPTLLANSANLDEPSFSPSGREVVADKLNADGDVIGLDVLNVTTGKRATLSGPTAAELLGNPSWAPDGSVILYTALTGDCQASTRSVPSAGGTPETVHAVTGSWQLDPQYSNDMTSLWALETAFDCTAAPGNAHLVWTDASDPTSRFVYTAPSDEWHLTVAGGTLAADTTPPAAPVIDGAGVVDATTATISWASAGPDVSEYEVVYVAADATAPATPADGTIGYDGPARIATVTGLTTGTVYDLYVFAVDASGNVSPPSARHQVRPVARPTTPASILVSSVSPNTSFGVSWTGSTAPSYEVQKGERTHSSSGWTAAPVYSVVSASTALTTMTFSGGQGHSVYVRVRGLDGYGNTTAWSTTRADEPLDDRYYGIGYSTGWGSVAASNRWLQTYRYTSTAGRTATLTADTTSFRIVGDTCASCGKFRVYVDGVLKATIDSYASSTKAKQVLYTGGFLGTLKAHTIKVVSLGTSGRPRVDIDGIALTR